MNMYILEGARIPSPISAAARHFSKRFSLFKACVSLIGDAIQAAIQSAHIALTVSDIKSVEKESCIEAKHESAAAIVTHQAVMFTLDGSICRFTGCIVHVHSGFSMCSSALFQQICDSLSHAAHVCIWTVSRHHAVTLRCYILHSAAANENDKEACLPSPTEKGLLSALGMNTVTFRPRTTDSGSLSGSPIAEVPLSGLVQGVIRAALCPLRLLRRHLRDISVELVEPE